MRISGYGQTGPLRDQPGFGTIAEAAGGLRYITGQPEGPPTRVGLSLGDSIASLHALVGAFIALHERERSGLGQVVDVALTESLFSMLESILPEYGYFGVVRERTGNIAHNSAPTNAYPCADGAEVLHRREHHEARRRAVPCHRTGRPRRRPGARHRPGTRRAAPRSSTRRSAAGRGRVAADEVVATPARSCTSR